ncbi:MAG: ATP-binding protein [Sedimentibacter sp.]|uniref:ATP-binding protein n=1 Tax=Sedimentibacter sp. TaxID=1960295 RepID=UPI003159218B
METTKKTLNVNFKDLFQNIDMEHLRTANEIKVPDEFFLHLLDYSMERSYLNNIEERDKFAAISSSHKAITWLQIVRLPVHPDNMENYDLISRWQGTLATLHAWGYRLMFLLKRSAGETHLYIGTTSLSRTISSEDAIEQVREAANANMPGVELRALSKEDTYNEIMMKMQRFNTLGAVTGIPSFRNNNEQDTGLIQTLDQLAFGIRDMKGFEKDYALLVIADPMSDRDTADIINKMRRLGSEIHTNVSRNVTEQESQGESKAAGMGGAIAQGVGAIAGGLLASAAGVPMLGVGVGGSLGSAVAGIFGLSKNVQMNFSRSLSAEYLDKFAQYAEEITDKHIARLNEGRNLGYWNVGVYILGDTKKEVTTVAGMLRSIYSGKESYLEPIRLHVLKDNSGALETVKFGYDLVPIISGEEAYHNNYSDKEWHIFGKSYQYLSTPMNTKELSLATSLPRRDVPGLRFVKTAVRFANNPAVIEDDSISLGKVVDMGVIQHNEYLIDPNALVRHALVTGSTGSGKTTTCKRIIQEVLRRNVPVMVIEPAKDDYVRWAIKMNETLPEDRKFQIYMPGVSELDGCRMEELRLNPFEPAAIKGARIDMLTRSENLTALLNASLPMSDVLPVIVDETVFEYLKAYYKDEFLKGEMEQKDEYPTMDGLQIMAKVILEHRNYEKRVQDNIAASIETRFNYLSRGTRGNILNVTKSTDYDKLFRRPAIINLSRIAGAKDKALIMSLLMISLCEYRQSCYANDPVYRKKAQKNKLIHLALVEEAHNLLLKPQNLSSDFGNPQQAVAELFSNMMSEIRGYGQGIIIADQIPTRLISDAVKNTNYKIVHRLTSKDDCEIMASSLALREDQVSIIPSLDIGNAIICGDMDDAAAWVKMPQI